MDLAETPCLPSGHNGTADLMNTVHQVASLMCQSSSNTNSTLNPEACVHVPSGSRVCIHGNSGRADLN
eukprot:8719685-Karenia_brevis.AAC.1